MAGGVARRGKQEVRVNPSGKKEFALKCFFKQVSENAESAPRSRERTKSEISGFLRQKLPGNETGWSPCFPNARETQFGDLRKTGRLMKKILSLGLRKEPSGKR